MPKYKAIITTRQGEQITLELSCREYHANKLNYVFSRTLDRAIYSGATVIAAADSIPAQTIQEPPIEPRRRLKKEEIMKLQLKKEELKKLEIKFLGGGEK